jgi:NADPH-dependent 2,4-dienoyl-CoA reductase/sulfur reductase-like enzyme/rhodanese-related sulfurtransferase
MDHREGCKNAIIVGGGFIGLEMAENLTKRGILVTIIEMLPQVMPSLDPEMVTPIHDHLTAHGVFLHLGDPVAEFRQSADGIISVSTKSGNAYTADLVILAIGVRPEIAVAKKAGLEIGDRGGIRVDDQMHTSDERIWAVGDAIETQDVITGEWILAPLAGPANRQGRIVAGAILGRDVRFRGVQATAICSIFGMTIASTGASEKMLKRANATGQPVHYEKIYLYPGHHVGYYPGAEPIALKLIFSPKDGRVLGAQAVGMEGVDKRIDVVSMAIQQNSTVFDLEEAELCYAPQFGAAKDPVNIAGMIAANALRGDSPIAHWEDLGKTDALIVDVRSAVEFEADHVEGAVNIPITELRQRMTELPRDRQIWAYCIVGQSSYYVTCALRLNGFDARNLSGGFQTYKNMRQFISW